MGRHGWMLHGVAHGTINFAYGKTVSTSVVRWDKQPHGAGRSATARRTCCTLHGLRGGVGADSVVTIARGQAPWTGAFWWDWGGDDLGSQT